MEVPLCTVCKQLTSLLFLKTNYDFLLYGSWAGNYFLLAHGSERGEEDVQSTMVILCGISQEPEEGGVNTEGKEQALRLAVKLQTEVVGPDSSSHPA